MNKQHRKELERRITQQPIDQSQLKKALTLILKMLDKKHTDKIESISYEEEDGVWIYLKKGWINPKLETHSIHEWELMDILSDLKDIEKCECSDCLEKIEKRI
mgnify:CR=1 FL=1